LTLQGHLEFFEGFEECARREVLEETNLVLEEVKFVSAENNFFRLGTPQRHYVTICLSGRATDESQLENTEPEKCEGWEWVSAADLLDDGKGYRPLFVPLRHIFVIMGLVQEEK
jgi:8-oxo-dGTP diphosphatase